MLDTWQGVAPFEDYLEVPSSRREGGGILKANKNNRDVAIPPGWGFARCTTMCQFILEFIIMPGEKKQLNPKTLLKNNNRKFHFRINDMGHE